MYKYYWFLLKFLVAKLLKYERFDILTIIIRSVAAHFIRNNSTPEKRKEERGVTNETCIFISAKIKFNKNVRLLSTQHQITLQSR